MGCMEYIDGMEQINSDIMERVLSRVNEFDGKKYNKSDVMRVLSKKFLDINDFECLLSDVALDCLNDIVPRAKEERFAHFGNNVYLFTPLYISNYCENGCIYCGFNAKNKILRAKLDFSEIEKEMEEISKTGMEEILILTGESRKMSDIEYISHALELSKKYFKQTGVEIYPVNVDEYKVLRSFGADYVTVFQETYNPKTYEKMHLAGNKMYYPYRFYAQERAIKAGMRGVAFGSLLGLDDYQTDTFATGLHAYYLQRKYPAIEISFSCPRLRPIVNNDKINPRDVDERRLLQIICAYRIFMPFAGITVSTRERADFRNNIIKIGATKISAGVSTGIGQHKKQVKEKGDNQFEIADTRSLKEIYDAIKGQNMQPVLNEYLYL